MHIKKEILYRKNSINNNFIKNYHLYTYFKYNLLKWIKII